MLRGPAFLVQQTGLSSETQENSSVLLWKREIHPALLGEYHRVGANELKHVGPGQVDSRCIVPSRKVGNKPVTLPRWHLGLSRTRR